MTEDIKTFLNRIRDEKKELIHLRLHKEDVRLSLLPGAIQYDKDRVDVSPDDPMLRMIQKLEKVEEKEAENEEKLLADIELANRIIATMPTPVAPQPDTARRIVGKSRGGMTPWYQCEICNEPVDVQDTFCSGCGRRLVDGCEKQAEEGR